MAQLKILSHNTFWFQGSTFPTDQPGAPNSVIFERLCSMYRAINADVICLQEIQSQETFEALSKELQMSGSFIAGKDLTQYGGAIFWRGDAGRAIQNSTHSQQYTQRMWQVAEIQAANLALSLCNVHLPSARQLGQEGAAAQRVAEMKDATSYGGVKPDIVAGDFNEYSPAGVAQLLRDEGYADCATIHDQENLSTNIDKWNEHKRGDFIWVKQELAHKICDYQVIPKEDFRDDENDQYLSDHLPLWITLDIEV